LALIVNVGEPKSAVSGTNLSGRVLILGCFYLHNKRTTDMRGSLEGGHGATAAG
jgi:hypothetical protein